MYKCYSLQGYMEAFLSLVVFDSIATNSQFGGGGIDIL
jgi:hypothetical protein